MYNKYKCKPMYIVADFGKVLQFTKRLALLFAGALQRWII